MNSSRPYLLRAIYEWIVDNGLTPYIMVDAMMPEVSVPERYVEGGKIVLNITPQAIGNFRMGNDAIEFDARFSGIAQHIYVPVNAIKAIYAHENGRGMVFSEEDGGDDGDGLVQPPAAPPSKSEKRPPAKKGRPTLKVVK